MAIERPHNTEPHNRGLKSVVFGVSVVEMLIEQRCFNWHL